MWSIRSRAGSVLLLLVPLLLVVTVLWSGASLNRDFTRGGVYAQDPPLAHTGGFGEPTCHVCHFGGDLNGGNGTLRIDGLPDTVRAGRTVTVGVELAADMARSGFMLAVRSPTGEQAGTLTAVDTARVAIDTAYASNVQYAHHTLAGTGLTADNRSRWVLRWRVPPRAADSALVHVAANAANDDASEFGDDIYATSTRVIVRP